MISITLIYLCGIETPSISQELQIMQIDLMRSFFNAVRQAYVRQIAHGNPSGDVCGDSEHQEWDGIKCKFGFVRSVKYTIQNKGFFSLGYLPNSIESIHIYESHQMGDIRTRLLPRSAVMIDLHKNRYGGCFDLSTLPGVLETLDVSSNRLQGPIMIHRLPQTLRTLNLADNLIKQQHVPYGKLPCHLETVNLSMNEIRDAVPMEPENKAQSKIFKLPASGWKFEDKHKKKTK